MTHQLSIEGPLARLAIAGPRLDAAATPGFKAATAALAGSGADSLLIDARALEFMDSTGLGALVSLSRMLAAPGRVALVGASGSVRRLLEITGLDRLFPLHDDADAARGALGR